jgi:hypothetical protein
MGVYWAFEGLILKAFFDKGLLLAAIGRFRYE